MLISILSMNKAAFNAKVILAKFPPSVELLTSNKSSHSSQTLLGGRLGIDDIEGRKVGLVLGRADGLALGLDDGRLLGVTDGELVGGLGVG